MVSKRKILSRNWSIAIIFLTAISAYKSKQENHCCKGVEPVSQSDLSLKDYVEHVDEEILPLLGEYQVQ
jgi:hypothetical protein